MKDRTRAHRQRCNSYFIYIPSMAFASMFLRFEFFLVFCPHEDPVFDNSSIVERKQSRMYDG